MDDDPSNGFRKLNYLLSNPPFPPETFGNLLLLHCKFQYYDLAADILAENAHLTYKFLPQVRRWRDWDRGGFGRVKEGGRKGGLEDLEWEIGRAGAIRVPSPSAQLCDRCLSQSVLLPCCVGVMTGAV
jgi:hypothetical protein